MSGKRSYRLGKRQASVDATRRRIIDAAMIEYAENGIDGTSMQAVARRADVAPGTVLYHYPDPDDLAGAAVRSYQESYASPSIESIPEDAPIEKRISALIGELYGVYERTTAFYRIYEKSRDHPAVRQASDEWGRTVEEMVLRALGGRSRDPSAIRVISALINPGFRWTLIETGFSPERSVDIAAQLAFRWLSAEQPADAPGEDR
jgi:AcrR family transcriptional regulator